MDTSQTQQQFTPEEQQHMLMEIYENTRKTKNYMKWQLIITVALVVIPLIATVAVIPLVLNQLSSIYTGAEALQ